MKRTLKRHWGNPSAAYSRGKASAMIIEKARKQLAKAIHAPDHEIYFTSCATESNNAVLKSLSEFYYPEKSKIIASPAEHPSVINTLEYLQRKGITIVYCSVDKYGFIFPEEISRLIDENTFLICCMLANNENGAIQNIKAVSEIARSKNVLLFSDCVQALGKIPIDIRDLGVDYASFSAHKLYGPKGCGALYAKIKAPEIQFIHGGHQEEGMRAGTESVHNIAGFGEACRNIDTLIAHATDTLKLKKYFEEQLKIPGKDIVINSPVENCIPNTMSVTFRGIKSSELMLMLDHHGISVSSGSACSTGLDKPSHVLKAMGLSDEEAGETIRISLGKQSKLSDLKYVLRVLKKYFLERD